MNTTTGFGYYTTVNILGDGSWEVTLDKVNTNDQAAWRYIGRLNLQYFGTIVERGGMTYIQRGVHSVLIGEKGLQNVYPEFDILAIGKVAYTSIVKSITKKSAAKTGGNVVYQGVDKATGAVKYVGITSRDPAIRFAEHAASGTLKGPLRYEVIKGAEGLTRTQARIWEQTLINQYGLGKNGGMLYNQINSIAPKYWWQYGITP